MEHVYIGLLQNSDGSFYHKFEPVERKYAFQFPSGYSAKTRKRIPRSLKARTWKRVEP